MLCAQCEECPFLDPKIPSNVYETHVTIEHPDNIDSFIEFCNVKSVKPVVLDLDDKMIDVMTTSRFQGEKKDAIAVTRDLANQLKLIGYNVLRMKVETTLTNPLSAVCENGNYYETHFAVEINSFQKEKLKEALKNYKVHVSNNMFKENVQMITFRSYEGNVHDHANAVSEIENHLLLKAFVVKKIINEYCIFDTNHDHDKLWLES